VAKLKSFTQAATVLYVSQPTRTAQIKKFKDALRSRLLGGRRRMAHNLLPMKERVLTGSEYGEARRAGGGRWYAAAWMRIAALPRRSFNLGPSRLPRKERPSPIIRAIGTRLNAGTWIRSEVRAGTTSPG
jgi:hypothetical protein